MARRRYLPILAVLCAAAQEPPTIRVTTTLVQVDAVVTGRDGKPVTGLTQDDFELLEDGNVREIRSFSYVAMGTIVRGSAARTAGTAAVIPANPGLKREDVRRTVAIVVDDLKMSFESLHYTREALKKFVAEQIAPDDLTAIMTTSGAGGTLRQFTTDRKLLRAAVDRISANLTLGGPASAVPALGGGEGDGDGQSTAALMRRQFAVGTLGSVERIAEGMRDMPGRKSLVLFSEGMRMLRDFVKEEPPVNVGEVMQVAQRANRASVVIHVVDPRGVVYPGMQAKDELQDMERVEVDGELGQRVKKLRGMQATLRFLAAETGGLAHVNNNDINGGLQRVLDNQSGYYLIGFQPGEEAAQRLSKEGKLHRLQVRVKRPGMHVRYRNGYMGETETSSKAPRTPEERLLSALASPFTEPGMALRFTPVFALNDKNRSVIRILLHIGGGDLTLAPPDGQGMRVGTLRLAAVTDGPPTQKSFTIRVKPDAAERLTKGGFVYSLEHEVKKAGPYQLRMAVLDELSGRTGSANRYVEVPDLSRGATALSGVSMANGDIRAPSAAAADEDMSPAIRSFERGRMFSYGVTVYNARLDPKSGQPAMEIQPRLIRGEAVAWEGKRIPIVYRPGTDIRKLPVGGVLTLGEKTLPGEYLLELQLIDPARNRVLASQWIDFELR